jgi:hypothetical protein
MRKRTFLPSVLAVFLGFGLSAAEQSDLEKNLSEIAGKAAKAYIQPVVDGFGTDFNAGWYHRSPAAKKFDLQIEGGFVMMGAFLGGAKKHFETSDVFQMDSGSAAQLVGFVDSDPDFAGLPAQARQAIKDSLTRRLTGSEIQVGFSGATVIGDPNDSVKMSYGGGRFTVNIPGVGDQTIDVPADTAVLQVTGLLNDLPLLPLLAPQVTLGTVFGTNVTLRYLPDIEINPEIGTVSYFGFGIQHNPSVWFGDVLPLDLSGGFFTQTFQLGSIFQATSVAMGINASKQFGWRLFNVTPYAGFMLERASMDISYQRDVETPDGTIPLDIDFNLVSDNHWRGTAGLSVRLFAVNINADYNVGNFHSVSLGVMFGI